MKADKVKVEALVVAAMDAMAEVDATSMLDVFQACVTMSLRSARYMLKAEPTLSVRFNVLNALARLHNSVQGQETVH